MVKPKAGDKVTVGGKELTWKKVKASDYYLDLNALVNAQGEFCGNALGIASVNGHDQIVHLYAFGVGKSERICLDRLIDRAPHLNDREAARQ